MESKYKDYTMVDLLNDEMEELIENLPQVKQLKAEIERLTEERESYRRLYIDVSDKHGESIQEIERLKEDNKRLNELLVGGTEVIDYWNNKYLEEQAKNTELQKKVDELARYEAHAEGINVTAPMSQGAHEAIVHEKVRQAVKDTAPVAINRFINQLHIDGVLKDEGDLGNELQKVKAFVLKRYYGVEVE